MRIYSNRLTADSVYKAFQAAREIAGADIIIDGGARSFTPRLRYRYGTEVFARSRHGKRTSGRAESTAPAASWDAWGWVIAYLYAQDPAAKIAWYNSRDDFIAKAEKIGANRREPKDFLTLVRPATSDRSEVHEHRFVGQVLRHSHPGGNQVHGYYEHPEDLVTS